MFDDCPKCGYPSKGAFKGIYTPGQRCDCGFVETDPEILALAAKERAFIDERSQVSARMAAAVQRVHGAHAPGAECANLTDIIRSMSALRASPPGERKPVSVSGEMEDLIGILHNTASAPAVLGDERASVIAEKKPELLEAAAQYLKQKGNPYADVLLLLAASARLQRDRMRAAAAKPSAGDAVGETLESTPDVHKFLEGIFSGVEGARVRRVAPTEAEARDRLSRIDPELFLGALRVVRPDLTVAPTDAEVRDRLSRIDPDLLLGALRVVRPDLADGFARTLSGPDLSTRWQQQSEGTIKLLTEQDVQGILALFETMKVARRKAAGPTESEMYERLAKADPEQLGMALRVIRGERAEGFAAAFQATPQEARIAVVRVFSPSEALRLFELVVRLESTMGGATARKPPATQEKPAPEQRAESSESRSDMQEIISSLASLLSASNAKADEAPVSEEEQQRRTRDDFSAGLFGNLPKDHPLSAQLQEMLGATTPEAKLAADRKLWATMGEDFVRMSQEPLDPTDAQPDPPDAEVAAREEAEMQEMLKLVGGLGDPGAAGANEFIEEAVRLMKDDAATPEERNRAVDAILAKAPAGFLGTSGIGMLEMFLRAPSQEARGETTRTFMGAMGQCLIARSKIDEPSKVSMMAVFEAALQQATHPARIRRALAAGLLAIGITDLNAMTSVDENRVQYCLLMVKPGDVAPITFEHDRVPPPTNTEEKTLAWLGRRRFLFAAAAALHSGVSLGGHRWKKTSDDGTDFLDEDIFGARPDGVHQLAAEDLDAMGRILGLTQPPVPAWLKEGVWLRGPIQVVHRGIGSVKDPTMDSRCGRANYVVTLINERVVHLTCTVSEISYGNTTSMHEERCERHYTIGTILAHFPLNNRAEFALGLPCAACGTPEPSIEATSCFGCTRLARERAITHLEQQLAARL